MEYALPIGAFVGILFFFWGVSTLLSPSGSTVEDRMAMYAGGAQTQKKDAKPQRRPPRLLQHAAPGHDHAALELAAGRLQLPAVDRARVTRDAGPDGRGDGPRRPRGEPRSRYGRGPREHGAPHQERRPRPHGHRDRRAAAGRRQPRG